MNARNETEKRCSGLKGGGWLGLRGKEEKSAEGMMMKMKDGQ